MAKPQEKTGSTALRPIAPPPLSQHLRELTSRPGAWAILARNLIPVVGIYGFGWSAALAVFNYWFDGLTALAAIAAALIPRALRETQEFDPSTTSSKKWLEKMANAQAKAGVFCHHISNNAPRDICELDTVKRKAGVEVAKKWLDGAAVLGAKSMRVNSGGPRIAPWPEANATGYPKNPQIEQYLDNCIESFKEMADYGAKVGVKVTLENHWGLTANPINIRIIIEEVNNVFCEASPDFCNWEHEYMLFNGLKLYEEGKRNESLFRGRVLTSL